MAAKKKPVATLSLADAGIEGTAVGLANATSVVIESTPRPPRLAGQVVTDDGDGAAKLAEYLIGQKLI
jgi:electron transfer flavoprotein beta subunit